MKQALFIVAIFFFLFACKKENNQLQSPSNYLKNLKANIKDSLAFDDFERLDFHKAVVSRVDSEKLHLLRIPFIGRDLKESFILLKTTIAGNVLEGRIIDIQQSNGEDNRKSTFNGFISISSLNRQSTVNSEIVNGYIQLFHRDFFSQRYRVVPTTDNEHVLPEVVVVCYVNNESSNWVNLLSLFGRATNEYWGYFSLLSGTGGGGGSASGGNPSGASRGSSASRESPRGDNEGGSANVETSSGASGKANEQDVIPDNVLEDETIFIDFEYLADNVSIDIEKYLKCFNAIPDNGATCSIEILTDIPVDNDPRKFFDWSTGSPGHTFLQIKKSNGSQEVMQNIGFYPVSGWKTIFTPNPIESKFADNGNHEFNASLKMTLTPQQLKSTLSHLENLAKEKKYDINEYNCTDLALEVFNYSKINPLVIPKYNIPNGMCENGTSTPQGLYQKLKSMKQSGIESDNINIPGVKGWVSTSGGPYN